MKPIYEIMHGDRKVAWIDTHGHCKVYYKSFMPFSLYLEETDNDVDTLVPIFNIGVPAGFLR